MLGSTLERITLPDDLVARLEGKSSLGRLGLLIHSTAGFIDPGWDGHVTLELSNVANLPITIYVGMTIGQLSFVQLTEPAAAPYGQRASARSTRARPARRRAATGRTSGRGRGRGRTMILLTGGTGFVGRQVAAALRADERPVRCLVRDRSGAEALAAHRAASSPKAT